MLIAAGIGSGMAKNVRPRFKSKQPRRQFFRAWRKFRGLTLEQAGERAVMTAGNISAMERGAQGFTQAGLEALAFAYNCEPAHLLMVDPTKDNAMWSLWERAEQGQRDLIVNLARQVVGRTGTEG